VLQIRTTLRPIRIRLLTSMRIRLPKWCGHADPHVCNINLNQCYANLGECCEPTLLHESGIITNHSELQFHIKK
jgi:hypothetical protein